MAEPFADKLILVLKALSISRARLAADAGVDKSVLARWATGATRPSTHNLALLSAAVARAHPGFTALDWDRDLADLARRLGVGDDHAGASPRDQLPLPLLAQARAVTAFRGKAYEGFYRSTRPYPPGPGRYIHDQCLVRLSGGVLEMRMNTGGVPVTATVLPLNNQLFVIGSEMNSGSLVFAVLHGANGVRVAVLDGITLYSSLDVGRTPTATPIILERVGELSGDRVADEARLSAMGSGDPVAAPGSIDEAMARHLDRDVGGDWVLRLPLALSRSGDGDN